MSLFSTQLADWYSLRDIMNSFKTKARSLRNMASHSKINYTSSIPPLSTSSASPDSHGLIIHNPITTSVVNIALNFTFISLVKNSFLTHCNHANLLNKQAVKFTKYTFSPGCYTQTGHFLLGEHFPLTKFMGTMLALLGLCLLIRG